MAKVLTAKIWKNNANTKIAPQMVKRRSISIIFSLVISVSISWAQRISTKQISLYLPQTSSQSRDRAATPIPESPIGRLETKIEEPNVVIPLEKYRISSDFGWRKHPLSGKQHFHNGVDLAAHAQIVRSIMPGKVQFVGYHKNLGKFIRIDHGFICSIYGHLSQIIVSSGEVLPSGFPLGITGSTGRTTGEHLHLSIRSGDTYIDPLKFLQGLLNYSTTNIN
jgi:murein DD-endopeptidase MepM/ murein hydrolase activator NlpD